MVRTPTPQGQSLAALGIALFVLLAGCYTPVATREDREKSVPLSAAAEPEPECVEFALMPSARLLAVAKGIGEGEVHGIQLDENAFSGSARPGPSVRPGERLRVRARYGKKLCLVTATGNLGWIDEGIASEVGFRNRRTLVPCDPPPQAVVAVPPPPVKRIRIARACVAVASAREGAEPVMKLGAGDTFAEGEVRGDWVRLADAPVEAWVRTADVAP